MSERSTAGHAAQKAGITPAGNHLLQRKPVLAVNTPGDAHEREADRAADAVIAGTALPAFSFAQQPVVHRDEQGESGPPKEPPKEKTDEEKWKEAAKKTADAFLKTPAGQEIESRVKEQGEAFVSTLPGKVITGAAIAGLVTGLAVAHQPLPADIPDIPLDRIRPGLKMRLTYEGPVDKPTKVAVSFSLSFGGGKADKDKQSTPTATDKYRAETARIARDQQKYREGLKTDEQRAQDKRDEQRMLDAWVRNRPLTPKPSPLSFGAAGSSFGVTSTPKIPAPTSGSGQYAPPTVTPSEAPAPEKKPDEALMRAAADSAPIHTAPPVVDAVLNSSGQPLDAGVRTLMEGRFGRSFGDVRVHSDAQAATSAAAVHARAYTVGRHVVFGGGRYAPHTPEGKRLLAHELAHVVQQTGGANQPHAANAGGVRSTPAALMRADDAAKEPDPVAVALKGDDDAARALTQHPKWQDIKLTPAQAAILLINLLDGATLDDDEQAGLRILRKLLKDKLFDEGLQALADKGRLPQLLDDYHGSEYRELLKLLSENMQRRSVKTVYLDAFIAMWWVREHEEEAIVVVLERTPLTDQVALLANTSRIGELRDAIDTERLSRRYEAIIAAVLGSQGQDLKTQLQGIFIIAANQSVTQGKRTQAEIGQLLSRATVDLILELADYKRQLDAAVKNPKSDSGDIAKINKEFEKRLNKLIADKSAEFGLELKYNIEFNRLLGQAFGRAWTPKDLQEFDKLLEKIPPDLLHANDQFRAFLRAATDPARPGLMGSTASTSRHIKLYGDLTFDTTVHELGHTIHQDDANVFNAFTALSGWDYLTLADMTRLIPDQKDRTRLVAALNADQAKAATDPYFQGDPHEYKGFLYRFSRYAGPTDPPYLRNKKDSCFISPYAATEPQDDFAESFAAYFDRPAELQQKCPDKYKFMHVRVMVEYRLGKQRGRVLKTFDDVVTKQFTDIDLLLGDTFKRAYTDPLRADLATGLDTQAAAKKTEAERNVNQKPQPISKTAEAEQLAKPYLDKLNALAKAAEPLLRGKQRFDDHAKMAKAMLFAPMQVFAYDVVISTLSKSLADILAAHYEPVAKDILAGKPAAAYPNLQALWAQYEKATDLTQGYLPYYLKSQDLSTAYTRFALDLLKKTPAGSKHDQVQKHASDRLQNAVRPAVEAWQKQVFDRLLKGLPFDSKAVEDPQKILTRFEQETRAFAAKIRVKRKAKNDDTPAADPAAVQSAVASPGRPLDGATQDFMEERLGRSFAGVRVHIDAAAQAAAQELNAQAFTVGDDVVFGAGQYAPETTQGKQLLAHELVHVMQQGDTAPAAPTPGAGNTPSFDITFESVSLPDDAEGDTAIGDTGDTGLSAPPVITEPLAATDSAGIAARPLDPAVLSPIVTPVDHPSERQAEQIARVVVTGDGVPARVASVGARHIQRAPTPAKPTTPGKDIVFIMGKDTNKKNPFYKEAVKFFKVAQPQATLVNDDKHRSLESVFDYLRANPDRVANLYLVSHANEDGTLSFPIHAGDKERKTTFGALSTALKDSPDLFKLPKGIVDANTTIHIKGCNIGRSERMLDALDQAFGGQGKVTAPTHKQVYGTEYTGKGKARKAEQYEALDVYFIEYKGNQNIARNDQLAAFQSKYPHLSAERWVKLIPKAGATRQLVATAFNFNYNTKVRDKTTKQEAIDAATAEAVKWGADNLARPDIVEWRVAAVTQTGQGWKVTAQAEKTNYVVDRILADEQGKRLNPPESDAKYYGVSTFGDPSPAAKATAAGTPGDSTSELLAEWLSLEQALADPLPQGDVDTQRARHSELERALKQRKLFVDVNVVKTEDWLGADEVYVKLAAGEQQHQTEVHKLNDGQRYRFSAPLAKLWPLRQPISLEVYDEDWPDRDDLIVKLLWRPPFANVQNTSSMDEANYQVTAQT